MNHATIAPGDARGLLQAAHDKVYRWPTSLTQGAFALRVVGPDAELSGTATLQPDSIDVAFAQPGELADWAKGEVAMLLGHRRALRYEDADGKNPVTIVDQSPAGVTIAANDAIASTYRISDEGLITTINRSPGGKHFTVDILDHVPAPGGTWLSHTFLVTHRDGDRINRVDAYRDSYQEADGLSLPVERRVIVSTDASSETRIIELTFTPTATETPA